MPVSSPVLTKPGVRNPAVLRRLVHDYVSGQWSILFVAILCMLMVAAANAAIPVLIKLTVKFLFVRKSEAMNVVAASLSETDIADLAAYYAAIEISVGKVPGR